MMQQSKYPNILLTYSNIYRFIATSVLIAIKLHDESHGISKSPFSNSFYAQITGIALRGII